MLALTTSSWVAPLGLVTKVNSIPNFRDLGGTPCTGGKSLRPALLLRSADLEDADHEDLLELKAECPDLRVIDLRGAEGLFVEFPVLQWRIFILMTISTRPITHFGPATPQCG